ncbi:MAG: AMP-binding protein [Pseudomonadota bacterium]|nr:AMP-binding protein [Pseudomonadota bacterium]
MKNQYYDKLETRRPAARERAQFADLIVLLKQARKKASGWGERLAEVKPASIVSRELLATLPVLRKSELPALQAANPPFGGLATRPCGEYGRVLMSPGPIFEPEGKGDDYWRTARAFHAAGFRKGDVVHNSFAYHLSPGAFVMEGGARAIGCAVVPAGIGNTEMQVEAIAHYRPSGFTGTPDYLKTLLDAGAQMGKDLASLKRALVSGGALFPALRQGYADRGINCLQCYCIAEVGLIAYESEAAEGMVVDEGIILEIVRPGTGDPVSDGEVGEVVVTSLNPDYPMIRLATGDLSAVMTGASPCGRTNKRIKGWLGRADQATKVKALFVRPEMVAEIARRHPELKRLRLVVKREGAQDAMTLRAEGTLQTGLAERVSETLQGVTKLKGVVEIVPPGSLPNDGKVIEDERSYA